MLRIIGHDMIRFGNLARRSQLCELGYSRSDLGRLIVDRKLFPIGRTWLAHPGASPSALRSAALGGRLAAASALADHGVWVTRTAGLWVGMPQHSPRTDPLRSGEHRLWVRERFPNHSDRNWRMSVADSLVQFARIGEEADVIASFDSALNKGLLRPAQLAELFDVLPRRLRRLKSRVRGNAQSGLETLLRVAAEAEGWNVQIQVHVTRVGHVDVLIDGWLVIELDSAEWHDEEADRDEDTSRDAELILLGYRWHRFRYKQVLERMPLCIEVIRTILASGRPVAVR